MFLLENVMSNYNYDHKNQFLFIGQVSAYNSELLRSLVLKFAIAYKNQTQ